jgi:hypothetical protein
MTIHWIAVTGTAKAAEIAGKAMLTAESRATGRTPALASATADRQPAEISGEGA